jgi:hypothetical protein
MKRSTSAFVERRLAREHRSRGGFMARRWSLAMGIVVLGALAAGAWLAPSTAEGDSVTPLGRWMKPNMGAPKAGEDYAALATAADFLATKVPSGAYPKWASYSSALSRAAKAKDMTAVKQACAGCHDDYKKKYKAEHASTPFP